MGCQSMASHNTFWFKRINHFRFTLTIFITDLDTFHRTGYLALTRLWLPGGYAYRDLYPAQTVLRYIVRAALYSCP